jgi:hypothetical protein
MAHALLEEHKIVNCAIFDVLHRIFQGVLYMQDVMMFYAALLTGI